MPGVVHKAAEVRGRVSRLAPTVAELESDALESVRRAFAEWGLVFNGTHLAELPRQVGGLVEWLESLAASMGDEELRSLALDSFRAGLRGEYQTPQGKSLVTGLLVHLLNARERSTAAPTITRNGAAVWRDNPNAKVRLNCGDCGFLIPAEEGRFDYEARRKLPPRPCLPACPECGGAFAEGSE